MPNIEHLEKRAELYLRWHREGYYPVAARIRAVLPKYGKLSDQEILASPFQLADAQELVARTSGFESWDALRRADHSPAESSANASSSTLIAAEPQLFVRDLPAALDFYQEQLGFTVAFAYGEPPFYAQVVRDGARLNLRWLEGPTFDWVRRESEQLLAASIALDDAKPLFLELTAAGVVFAQSLRSEPWGARTFIVRDPDGNLILFAGPDE